MAANFEEKHPNQEVIDDLKRLEDMIRIALASARACQWRATGESYVPKGVMIVGDYLIVDMGARAR